MKRGGLLAFAIAAVLALSASSTETLDVYFINVGHGDAILIDLGDWEALLDAGRGYSSASSEILEVLNDNVADHIIELAILSHYHADHYGGFEDVLDAEYRIGEFWVSQDPAPDTQGQTYACFVEALRDAGLERTSQPAGVAPALSVLGSTWTLLGPSEIATSSRNDNNNSLVLLVEFFNFALLFTGDIEAAGEGALIGTSLPDSILILKVSHHGSDTSTSDEFLDWAEPGMAVISASAQRPPAVNRLSDAAIPVYTTATHGTVHVRIDTCGCWVETDLAPGLIECCLAN